MSYWMKITKTSVTCPFCNRRYHMIDKIAAELIQQDGCGCEEKDDACPICGWPAPYHDGDICIR